MNEWFFRDNVVGRSVREGLITRGMRKVMEEMDIFS